MAYPTVTVRRLCFAAAVVVSHGEAVMGVDKIRDNLFLMEEAYNQEPGVIQHIQGFVFNPRSAGWNYSFTEEWPLPTDRHQLSLTLPASHPGTGGAPALSDLLVNYRLQAIGAGGAGRVAMAPRVSLVLPTGDYRTGGGRGAPGVQVALPLSLELGDRFVTHLNAGSTLAPGAKSPGGRSATSVDTNAGIALVWLPRARVNVLLEVLHVTAEEIPDLGASVRRFELTVNPGIRVAFNFRSGLQIVPGVSAPVRLVGGVPEVSALAYLSFEHPAWKPRTATSK